MVPAEDASIQKTIEKLAGSQCQEQCSDMIFQGYSLIRHVLNKLQANLSLSNTTHSIQQKMLSLLNLIISTVQEMLLQFGNNSFWPVNQILGFGMSWTTTSDVPLLPKLLKLICRDLHHQLALWVYLIAVSRTVLAALIVQSLKPKWWAPEKTCVPLMLNCRRWQSWGAKGRKERVPCTRRTRPSHPAMCWAWAMINDSWPNSCQFKLFLSSHKHQNLVITAALTNRPISNSKGPTLRLLGTLILAYPRWQDFPCYGIRYFIGERNQETWNETCSPSIKWKMNLANSQSRSMVISGQCLQSPLLNL